MPIARSHGFKISYEISGDGPPLVLHPGMFQTGASWRAAGYTEVLEATHTVIAIDPLGLGSSDGPHEAAAYALERRVESVTSVLDEVGAESAAFWGYSMGGLTALGMAIHAPERCTRLVIGAWDPVEGFASGVAHALRHFGLPADTDVFALLSQSASGDPAQAAVIDAGDPAAFRANFEAFSREGELASRLGSATLPMLMYSGTEDPWHEPLREVAERLGAGFFSVPGADHLAGWKRAGDVLPHVRPFLGGS
ncbi:alpha/beta fold hydrolase [Streptomyces sp. ME19-01-6]|uniref:alpha/beta fold hydrolase n=1 Tax=Streptomyces sp. ME19-01-6 TaxID=3028686 RepID=UPI0029A374FF|nr:alpha/beta fold hydrolase [Streptomyces sp. ME19-01-6]MDX3226654.1 alpha/beta fold hydrolase [Streptomyces sp. ME19-01-6]